MTFYILLALSSFMLTLLGTRLTILAFRKRIVPIDPASLRANYKKPPLKGGGVAVVMALIICLLVADINYGIILAMFLLAAMSLLGELIVIPLLVRLLVQLLAVLIAINVMASPVFGGFLPPWLDKTCTAILWVWFINLFKLMDGIDGISPMEMICIGMGMCLITVLSGRVFPDPLSTYGLIVASAGCGFIWWNWYPAKILLGAVGSVPIGFLLGYLLVMAVGCGYPYAAAILPAYHVSDATLTMIRRIVKGKKLIAGYSDYYYLRALRSGRKPDAVVRYMFGINFLLIFQAVFSVIDPALSIFYVGMAYATVFMILGFFAHTAHDPEYEPFKYRFKFHWNRNIIAALHDALMASISFVLSIYIRLGTDQFYLSADYLVPGTIVFTLVSVAVFLYMRLYRGLWRYASMRDMIGIVKAVTLSVLIFAVLMFTINRLEGLPRSLLFINWMLLLFMLAGPRFAYRAFKDRTFVWSLNARNKIPVLLIGAGNHAEQFIRDMSRDPQGAYDIVGIVDDDREQKGRTIHRVPIYGGTDALAIIMRKLERKGCRPHKWILSDDRISGTTVRHLLEVADSMGVPLARLPRLSEFKHSVNDRPQVRPIAVEDLLGRAQNVLDRDSMQRFVEGRKVLITGAGGTIGSELTRQISQFNPSELILIELSEFNLYHIEHQIRDIFPDLPLTVLLADIRDTRHIDVIFRKHQPNLVFHAAAIKHVPMAEKNIEQAVLTNVFGTSHIAEACQKYHADVMVMISTDKAVNPGNVMGATKRLAESFCQSLGRTETSGKGTKFFTVRFGNVLGSTGSVVPLFEEQLAKGGPLTVTHPDMVRYFMTVREAVELVLQAAVLGDGMKDRQECIFVLDMGQPVRILDLATQMIKLAGFRPNEDIEIVFTGLRPGEKLFEELFHFSENAVKTTHEGIFLASPRFTDMATLRKGLEKLFVASSERKAPEALAQLKLMVPEFKSLFEH